MLRSIMNGQKGATAIIVALSMVVLLGMAALVVDAGVLFEERRLLQNAVDAAALAGAQQIPVDVMQATAQAYAYANANGVSNSEITQNRIVTIFNGGDALRVHARRQVNLFFAPVLGSSFSYVDAEATAILTKIQPTGVWPWGVTQDSIQPGPQALKLGSRDSMIGNFMALDFGSGSGADSYREFIKYGYGPAPAASDLNPWSVPTETGNLAGPTMQGISWVLGAPSDVPVPDIRNPRVGLLPILSAEEWSDVIGRTEVQVVGFAVFYIEDYDQAQGPQGLLTLYGSFLQFAYGVGRSVDVGGGLDGLIGARLWE